MPTITSKASLKRYLQPGVSLKMTYGYLANTPAATLKIQRVQSNAIIFEPTTTQILQGHSEGSQLRFNDSDDIYSLNATGFEIWYKVNNKKILAYEYVEGQ